MTIVATDAPESPWHDPAFCKRVERARLDALKVYQAGIEEALAEWEAERE